MQPGHADDGRSAYLVPNKLPIGLTIRSFALILVDFMTRRPSGAGIVSFRETLYGLGSPGKVLRIADPELRMLIDSLAEGVLADCLRFQDTADTQSLILDLNSVPDEYRLEAENTAIKDIVYA